MRKLPLLFILLAFSFLLTANITPAHAMWGDAYDLADIVNQLRVANGLAEYQLNTALMISAQAHSEYQASLGIWTHNGADGTDESQRARAAGYGGGAQIKCDEAAAYTIHYDANKVVYEMWQDAAHLKIMLSAEFKEAGTGAAVSGDYVFFTLDACVVIGGSYPSTSGNNSQASTPIATPVPILPATVTPLADGSIIHVVREGETLITISMAYNIPLKDLLEENNLTTKSVIYPGDKLTIRLANTPTPTSAITDTPTPRPATPTRRPTRTPTVKPPTPTTSATLLATPTPTVARPAAMDTAGKVMVGAIFVLGVGGAILFIAGGVLKRIELK
jgi:LysM repeat protein